MKPRAFGALTGGKTLPCAWIEITGDLLRCAGDRRLSRPRAEIVVRFNPKNVAFAGLAQGSFDVPDRFRQKLLAFPASSMRASHIRRRPVLIDEHEPLWVEIELVLEPALSLFLDVRTALLYRMASLFLRVWSCRTRNRCRADLLAMMPWPARALRSSNNVPSRCSPSQAMIRSA